MRVHTPAILPFVFAGAVLYTSVGHGGATVYLAILTLAGFEVARLVTVVLSLNILAAGIAFVAFRRAGHLRWELLLPFLITAVPAAYLGGRIPLESAEQALILGLALLAAGLRLLLLREPPRLNVPRAGLWLIVGAPAFGALFGFLAGTTGIGGGIFLSPLILILGWGSVKEAGSVASAFIVLNSAAGLLARIERVPLELDLFVPLAAVVIAGALVGSYLGANRIPSRYLQALLGVVLIVAGLRALLI